MKTRILSNAAVSTYLNPIYHMKLVTRVLLSAAVLGFVACSEAEQKETITTAPLNLPTSAPVTDTSTQDATAGLNPAHGQPNHRCDIPVGTPLSAPAQPNLSVQPTVAPPTPKIKGAVAGGINPPHGELGHDCSVPVGAALN
ncbi:hypothetical protein GCM10027443_40430 [Pontibacter brevis]